MIQTFKRAIHEIRDLRSEDQPQSDGNRDQNRNLHQFHTGAAAQDADSFAAVSEKWCYYFHPNTSLCLLMWMLKIFMVINVNSLFR